MDNFRQTTWTLHDVILALEGDIMEAKGFRQLHRNRHEFDLAALDDRFLSGLMTALVYVQKLEIREAALRGD